MKLFFALALLTLGTGCFERVHPPKPIAPLETMGLLQNDFAILVDLREAQESETTGRPLKARVHPLSSIEKDDASWKAFVSTLVRSKAVVLLGNSPRDLDRIGQRLSEEKYDVRILGAFNAWKNAGLPMESPSN
jgi:rhodanese-related sulfurtransferase